MKLTNFAFLPPLDDIKKELLNRLKNDFPEIEFLVFEDESEVLENIHIIQAGYGWISPEAILNARELKWLANPDSGSFVNESGKDGWFYKELVEHPVVVTNPRGIYFDYIGNHVMAYLLSLSKRFPDFLEAQRKRSWNKNANRHKAIHLDEATVMIVGAGGIGQEVGRLCKAFNMNVIGVDPKFKKLKHFDKLITQKEIEEEISEVDVLVSTVMHTPETHHMFNLELFNKISVDLIEQPLPHSNDQPLLDLNSTIPICADESFHTIDDFKNIKGKYDSVNIKLDKTGGLTEALKIAQEAERNKLKCMVGCMVSTSLSMLPAAILYSKVDFLDLDGPCFLIKDQENGISYERGKMIFKNEMCWG